MQCEKCKLTSICKIFEIVNNFKHSVDITINNCNINSTCGQQKQEENTFVPPLVTREFRDLNKVSDLIKAANVAIENNDDDRENCVNCDSLFSKKDLERCAECNQWVCYGCLVENVMTRKFHCQSCYDKLDPAIL